MTDYPYLKELTNADLVALLSEYVHKNMPEDADFIKALQSELKTRKPEDWDKPNNH